MNLVIPWTKDIKFATSIGEILSISLENDWTANEGELLGNFTVSGEYKTHEVSVNKEPFEYVLPFSVSLSETIDLDTIDLEVKDFSYDIKDGNTLHLEIEYQVTGKENERNDDFETMLDEAISNISDEVVIPEETREEIKELTEEDTGELEQELINTTNNVETYVTYHIHIIKENETINSICKEYNTTENIIKEYNDYTTLDIGDKLIIPDLNE